MTSLYHQARHLVKQFQGPIAKVVSCPFCEFRVTILKTGPDRARNHLTAGGGAVAKVASHISKTHADKMQQERTQA